MEKIFPTLTLESKFPFGKHKGKVVQDILIEDTDYLLWLRQQRFKDNGGPCAAGMSDEIHQLLDSYLENNRTLMNKGYQFRYAGPPVKPDGYAAANEDEESAPPPKRDSANWGAWA